MIILTSVNCLAVFVAAAAGYVLGGLWYSPAMFGPAYIAALGKKKKRLSDPTKPMVVTIFTTIVTAWALALLISTMNVTSWLGGAWAGLTIGLGVVAATMLSDYLFANWSAKLFWIQAGYRTLYITLMAVILGGWH